MAILEKDSYLLVPESVLDSLSSEDLPDSALSACNEIANWTYSFLVQSHTLLGRDGPVCPFTRPSLRKHLFWLAPYIRPSVDEDSIDAAVKVYLDWFLSLDPISGPDAVYKTILILFPSLSAPEAVDILQPLQRRLKPDFVKRGLMVGQFYKGCEEPGLWNDQFRPLQAPIPLLAIRHMVPSDFPFLHGTRGGAEMLSSYFTQFGHTIPSDVRHLIIKALEDYENRHPEDFRS